VGGDILRHKFINFLAVVFNLKVQRTDTVTLLVVVVVVVVTVHAGAGHDMMMMMARQLLHLLRQLMMVVVMRRQLLCRLRRLLGMGMTVVVMMMLLMRMIGIRAMLSRSVVILVRSTSGSSGSSSYSSSFHVRRPVFNLDIPHQVVVLFGRSRQVFHFVKYAFANAAIGHGQIGRSAAAAVVRWVEPGRRHRVVVLLLLWHRNVPVERIEQVRHRATVQGVVATAIIMMIRLVTWCLLLLLNLLLLLRMTVWRMLQQRLAVVGQGRTVVVVVVVVVVWVVRMVGRRMARWRPGPGDDTALV
jgi:hypothetical protein